MANTNFMNAMGGFAQGFMNAYSTLKNLQMRQSQLEMQKEQAIQRQLERQRKAKMAEGERLVNEYEETTGRRAFLGGIDPETRQPVIRRTRIYTDEALAARKEAAESLAKRLTAETGEYHFPRPIYEQDGPASGVIVDYTPEGIGVKTYGPGRLSEVQMQNLAKQWGVDVSKIDPYGNIREDKSSFGFPTQKQAIKAGYRALKDKQGMFPGDEKLQKLGAGDITTRQTPSGNWVYSIPRTRAGGGGGGGLYERYENFGVESGRIMDRWQDFAENNDNLAWRDIDDLTSIIGTPDMVVYGEDAVTATNAVLNDVVRPDIAYGIPNAMSQIYRKLDMGSVQDEKAKENMRKYAENIWLFEPNKALVPIVNGVPVPRGQVSAGSEFYLEPFRKHIFSIYRKEYGPTEPVTGEKLDKLFRKYSVLTETDVTRLPGSPTIGALLPDSEMVWEAEE